MKQMNPFFVVGTIGMIITAVLHIIMAVVVGDTSVHTTFFIMYPIFTSFFTIGTAQLLKKQKLPVKTK